MDHMCNEKGTFLKPRSHELIYFTVCKFCIYAKSAPWSKSTSYAYENFGTKLGINPLDY